MSDPEQLRPLIEAEQPDLVVPEIEAIATPVLEALEAEGTIRCIPTARAARLTMDREGIRRLAAEELDLPTSPYRFCDSLAELQAAIDGSDGQPAIGYPCIVKPVMSSSGKGQSKIDGRRCAEGLGLRHGRRPRGHRPHRRRLHRLRLRDHPADRARRRRLGQVETHFCDPIGHVQVSGDYVESWQPHPMSPVAQQRRARSPRPSPPTWAARACSASSCSSRATWCGSARSAPARTTPAW
jgi:phosphoribosylglycinamide formyltransferase 2